MLATFPPRPTGYFLASRACWLSTGRHVTGPWPVPRRCRQPYVLAPAPAAQAHAVSRDASLMLGGVFLAEGVWLTAIVWLAARVSAILSRSGIRRRMERLTGLVMVGFGVRLAIGRR